MILTFINQGMKVRLNGIETSHSTLMSGQALKKAFMEKLPMVVL